MIRCHGNSVKKDHEELSPDVFLTVSEVGVAVRMYVAIRAEHSETGRHCETARPWCGVDGATDMENRR